MRLAFLLLCFLGLSAEDCGETTCRPGLPSAADCPTGAQCVRISADEGRCVPLSATPEAMGTYLNKRRQVCEDRGHDFTGKRGRTNRFPIREGCERVWETKQCRRCLSDVMTGPARYEGPNCPPEPGCE